MAQIALKLVDQISSVAPHSLRFEQRRATRHVVTGRATAVTKARVTDGQQSRIRSLQLMNLSDTGLGAICQDSFDVGTTIAIFLPPHGPDAGLDVYGQVVRCTRHEYGHEIGIQFAIRAAA